MCKNVLLNKFYDDFIVLRVKIPLIKIKLIIIFIKVPN
jgi:hypothetical protein